MEKQAVVRALETTRGNKLAAAQLLGINRTTLYKKMRRFGLR
jgi:two-component system response regulator HydG